MKHDSYSMIYYSLSISEWIYHIHVDILLIVMNILKSKSSSLYHICTFTIYFNVFLAQIFICNKNNIFKAYTT